MKKTALILVLVTLAYGTFQSHRWLAAHWGTEAAFQALEHRLNPGQFKAKPHKLHRIQPT